MQMLSYSIMSYRIISYHVMSYHITPFISEVATKERVPGAAHVAAKPIVLIVARRIG